MKDKRSITRSQIIDAASACFAEYGYDKTTFDDVAKKAGISRTLIYTYFKSKQEFFFAMMDEKHKNYLRQSQEVLNSDLSGKEKLRKIIDIWIIDPHRIIYKSPLPNIWLKPAKSIQESEKLLRGDFIKSLVPLIGHDLAEVIVYSYKGLLDDKPPIDILEKRTDILINNLKISSDTN
jgi:TetR/AcrR family transcriptional regulator, transcriptional repressor of aconitase